jgi:branched-chain amino acid transport system ATP-binding protein
VQSRIGHWRELFGPAISAAERAKALEILEFLGITRLAFEETRSLSYGQKKLMDFGALLMSDPKIILLDEPAGGVNPRLLDEIMGHIQALNERGLTVLVVEHNMNLVMRLSHKVVVMAHGQIIAEGSPKDIQSDEAVLSAYLGGDVATRAGHG